MPKKILLVEDQALIALNETRIIEKHRYEVETVYSGEQAVETALSDSSISLILMDIDLGSGIDGTEAARKILVQREIPVVFLTSHTEEEYVDRVKKISRYGYVLKNSGEFVLIEAINMAFELFNAHKKTKEQEKRYRSLINNSPFGVSVIDRQMRFVAANPVMAEALNTSVESMIGQPLSAFFEGREYDFRLEQMNSILEKGESRSFEVKRGGRLFHTTLVPHSTDETTTVQVILQDVTERKREIESLERYGEELSALYEHTPNLMFLLDEQLQLRKANARVEEFAERSESELFGSRIGEVLRCINSLDDPRGCGFGPFCRNCPVRRTILESLESRKANTRVEAEIPREEHGEEENLSLFVSTFPLSLYDEAHVIVSIEDISVFKENERRLEEHVEKYRSLFGSIRDAILVADTDRKIVDCNPAFSDLFGYRPDELKGRKTVTVYESEEEYDRMGEAIKAHRGNLSDFLFTVRYLKKDGTTFPGETNVFYLHDESGNVSGFIGLIRDVSVRLETERRLRESEKNLRITLDSIGDAVVSTGTEGQIVRMNPVAESLSGWREEEASGRALEEVLRLVNADTGEEVENPVKKVLETGNIMGLANHTMLISKNGDEFQIADSAAPIWDENGEIDGVVLVFRDVSGEYEKERRLHTLMKNLPGMAYRCKNDRRWTMEFVSHGCFDLTGFTKEELEESRTVAYGALIFPEDNERVWQDVQEALTGQQYFTVRYRIRTKEGKEKWVWEQGVGIHSTDGSLLHIEGFVTDISSEMKTRSKLEQALGEKDALMRELTHRVKNNLSMVSSLIRLKDEEIDEDLSDIIHRIDTVQLVHDKLHKANTVDRIDMRGYIQEVLDTLFSFFTGYRVEVVNNIEEVQLQPQRAVPVGLIVNELATNAIQHGFNEQEKARFSVHMKNDNDSVSLIVTNTGNPIPTEIDFENPHSLGLQLISTLVHQIGGTIATERTPLTKFVIRFPPDL